MVWNFLSFPSFASFVILLQYRLILNELSVIMLTIFHSSLFCPWFMWLTRYHCGESLLFSLASRSPKSGVTSQDPTAIATPYLDTTAVTMTTQKPTGPAPLFPVDGELSFRTHSLSSSFCLAVRVCLTPNPIFRWKLLNGTFFGFLSADTLISCLMCSSVICTSLYRNFLPNSMWHVSYLKKSLFRLWIPWKKLFYATIL